MTHLRFDMLWAPLVAHVEQGHPQEVMRDLGITYQHATPQSIGDQWWFWNCENLPDPLPAFLSVANWDPMKMIGFGLSKEDADRIRDYKTKTEE